MNDLYLPMRDERIVKVKGEKKFSILSPVEEAAAAVRGASAAFSEPFFGPVEAVVGSCASWEKVY